MLKKQALKQGGFIFTHKTFGNYQCASSHSEFVKQVIPHAKATGEMFCEYIKENNNITLFFDIDGCDKNVVEQMLVSIDTKILQLADKFKWQTRKFILDSSLKNVKTSKHVIYRFYDSENNCLMFKNIRELKLFIIDNKFADLNIDGNKVDLSVYRAGLFRTIYSDKNVKGKYVKRPLLPEGELHQDEIILTLLTYAPEKTKQISKELWNSQSFGNYMPTNKRRLEINAPHTPIAAKKFHCNFFLENLDQAKTEYTLQEIDNYRQGKRDLSSLLTIYTIKVFGALKVFSKNFSSLPFYVSYSGICYIANRYHKSNCQYILIYRDKITVHCHDENCSQELAIYASQHRVIESLLMLFGTTPMRKQAKTNEIKKFKNLVFNQNAYYALETINFDTDYDVHYCDDFYICTNGFWECFPESIFIGWLTEEFMKYFRFMSSLYSSELPITDARADSEIENKKDISSLIRLLIDKAGNCEIAKKAARIIKSRTYSPTFKDKLDKNPNIVSFQNGVYIFEKETFRLPNPEDYVCNRLNFDYDPSIMKKEVKDFLRSIFKNEATENYILYEMAMALRSYRKRENILFLIGEGANGKSTLINFFLNSLSIYANVATSGIFKASNTPNVPRSDLVALKNKRLTIIPDLSIPAIDAGCLKMLTGGDKITARDLYGRHKSFANDSLIIVAANTLPRFIGDDDATWRRVKIIPFQTKFVETPVNPDECLVDVTVKRKVTDSIEWMQTFINILLSFKPETSVVESCNMLLYKKQYKSGVERIEDFLDTNLEEKKGRILTKKEIMNAYYDYYQLTVDKNIDKQLKKKIVNYMIQKFKGQIVEGTFRDYVEKKVKRGYKNLKLKLYSSL